MVLGRSTITSGRRAANMLGICVAFVAGPAARGPEWLVQISKNERRSR
jgi:hypothetical protein